MADDVSRAPAGGGGLLALARFVSRLKAVPRTGWLDRGIDPRSAESVADHSFGVALLAWAAAKERASAGVRIDAERVLLLALIHDLAEAATGDIPPYQLDAHPELAEPGARREFLNRAHHRDTNRQTAKQAAEDVVMASLMTRCPPAIAAEIQHLWAELRSGETEEAKFVKQVDRLETFLQSRYYLESDSQLPMESFRHEVSETILDPLLAAVRDAALADSEQS